MSNLENHTDVLIVGAGPVGLFLANECARRGLSYRIVETHATQSEHSKALAIFPRTLEIFDMAGLVAPFLEAANRVTSVAIVAHGHSLAHMRFTPEESPYQFVAMVPQDVTEKLLADHLRSAGARSTGSPVEYETTFVSAAQHEDHVAVALDHKGEGININARFVVGCDGAHSTVRHAMNLPFEGAEYEASFMLADVETNDALPADEMQLCPSELGPVAIFPMSSTRRRIVAVVNDRDHEGDGLSSNKRPSDSRSSGNASHAAPSPDAPSLDAPSLEMVRQLLAERAPAGIEALSVRWSTYFRIHHRQCARLQVGRIFIAGDAAHIHSPFGGQGMNTGLQDVWNLVWKLDLVLHGHGSHELLESYTAERRPVIKSVIETTHFLTRALGTPSKLAQLLRNAVIPMVSRLAPFQHAFVQRLSELGIAYSGSPIVEGTGERYFDNSLRGGNGIRSRFLLMIHEDADMPTKDAAALITQSFKEIVEFRMRREHGIALLRPDGYIAYSSAHDGPAAFQHVRSLLERQTVMSQDLAS